MTEDVTHADLVGIKEDVAVLKEQIREIRTDAAERKMDFKADMADLKKDTSELKIAIAGLRRTEDIKIGKSIAFKTVFGTGLAGLGAGAVKIIEFFTAHPTP